MGDHLVLRKAYFDGMTFANLGLERLPVGFKHHLDRVPTNPGEVTTFYNFVARTKVREEEGLAWEWGEDFKLIVARTSRMIIAEPEWNGGKVVSADIVDCGGAKLTIAINRPLETIRLLPSDKPASHWEPDGYSDPEHLWNHPHLRS